MTDDQIEAIWKANIGSGAITAMRAMFTHGYCEGASVTPSASVSDKSVSAVKPTTIIKLSPTSKKK